LVGEKKKPRCTYRFRLTSGDARYVKVEKAYRAALAELKPGGNPSDAITDRRHEPPGGA